MPSKVLQNRPEKCPQNKKIASNEVGTDFYLGFFSPRGNTKELSAMIPSRVILEIYQLDNIVERAKSALKK